MVPGKGNKQGLKKAIGLQGLQRSASGLQLNPTGFRVSGFGFRV